MPVNTAAGTVIAISAQIPATFDQAGYEASAMVFTNIGEITDGGEHGGTHALVTHMPIASRVVQKFKGSRDEGNKTIQMGLDHDDAGQVILKAAQASDNNYSFRVSYPGGDFDYFQAKVMRFSKATTGVDTIISATTELAIVGSSAGIGVVEVTGP